MNWRHYIAIMSALLIISIVISLLPSEKMAYPSVFITEVETKALGVNESHVVLQFIIGISNRNKVDDLTVSLTFTDMNTNLLLYEFKKELKNEKREEFKTTISCAVSKFKDYIVKISVMKDNKTLHTTEKRIIGLKTLPPANRDVSLTVKGVDFRVTGKSDGNVDVKAMYYMESPIDYGSLIFHVKAVQLESNIVADDFWAERGVSKGKTDIVQFNLTLKDGYNYMIVLEVWKEGYLVKSWKDYIKFNPKEVVRKENKSTFRVEDFVTKEIRTPVPVRQEFVERKLAPGFGFLSAILAGGGAIWIIRRL